MSAAAGQMSMSANTAAAGLALAWPPLRRQVWPAEVDAPTLPAATARAAAALDAADAPDFAAGDRGFIALCAAYRASGGIARPADLGHWLAGRGQGDSHSLATLIANGDVFSFDWRQTRWLPVFQLQAQQPGMAAPLRQVLAELAPVMDGWQLAAWFVQANAWLAAQRPLDLLAEQPARVLAAARADRYVVKG